MPYQPIPLNSLDLSVDKYSELATYGQMQMDGYWKRYISPDGPKFIWTKRPGLTAWADTTDSAAIWDLFYTNKNDFILAVDVDGSVWKIKPSTAAVTDITGTAAMDGAGRPSFAEYPGGANVAISNLKKIGVYPIAPSTGAYQSDADCPTTVRSVAVLNNILLASNAGSRRFDWSAAGTYSQWDGEYANTETAPGEIKRMIAADNYLWFFKTDALEVWRDDGTTFVRESQGSIRVGCTNEDSIVYISGSFYFLDNNLDVRRLSGFSWPETISNPFLSNYIANITDFSEVQGHHLRWDGKDFYILQFVSSTNCPCLVYDIELGQWYQWGYYSAGAYQRWPIRGICTADNGIWYAGDYGDGLIHKITGTQDLGVDIYTRLRTDFIDRGAPDTYKFCNEITLLMKRSSTAATAKTISVRYRDDGTQTWSTAVTAAIEAASTTELKVNLRRLGRYKRRQWEFLISDATVASLVGAWERFEVGR